MGRSRGGQTYDQELRKEQRIAKEFRKENPTAANLAAGTGMAAPAVLTMGVGMGPTAVRVGAKTAGKATTEALGRPGFMRRVAGGTAAGGTYGAVYGSGKAEGGVEERLAGAVEPGAVGAAVGSAIPIVGAISRAAISHISKRIAAKKAGIDPRAVDPIQEALESGAEGVAKGVKDPIPDSLWADLYPETRGLLSTALVKLGRFGNKGRKEIGRRADESGARVGQSLDDTLGTPEGLETAVARMTAESKPVLDRLYAQAEATPIQYIGAKGQKLLNLIKGRRVPKQALTEAKKLLDADEHINPQRLFKFDADGNYLGMERPPDVKEVRAIIDGMQQLIEGQRSDLPGKFKPLGRSLIKVQKDMKGLLGDLVPDYAKASAIAEPQFMAKDAIKLGQDAVGVNMSSSAFKAELAALKAQHPRIKEQVEPLVRKGIRNRIQDLGERAKTAMAPAPGVAGRVGRFEADDPTTIRLIKNLSSQGLKEKVATVTGTKKATGLFRDIDKANESILTRESLEKNVREAARKVLDDAPGDAGSIVSALDFQLGTAAKKVGKLFSPKTGSRPGKTDAAVANALVEPADRGAMTNILQLRHKSERGMVGAKRAEAVAGGYGLVTALGNQEDGKTRGRTGAEYLMDLMPERLTGLVSAP